MDYIELIIFLLSLFIIGNGVFAKLDFALFIKSFGDKALIL